MKKTISILLVLVSVICLSACGEETYVCAGCGKDGDYGVISDGTDVYCYSCYNDLPYDDKYCIICGFDAYKKAGSYYYCRTHYQNIENAVDNALGN